jgi:hypothetical protein
VDLFAANPAAVLGDRRLLWPRGNGYQWNPDDSGLVLVSLRAVPNSRAITGEWVIKARLFETLAP